MKSYRNSSFVRLKSRTLPSLALFLGLVGIAQVSHATPTDLQTALVAAGDSAGTVAAATATQLDNAIGSLATAQVSDFVSDLNYVTTPGTGLSQSTFNSDYAGIASQLSKLGATTFEADAAGIALAFGTLSDSNKALAAYDIANAGDSISASVDAYIPTIASNLASTLAPADLVADEGTLAADAAYPIHVRNADTGNPGLAGVANAVASLPGQTAVQNAAIVNQMAAYSYYNDAAVITATTIENTTLNSSVGGAANAATITQDFASEPNILSYNYVPQVAGATAAYLYTHSATSYAPAVAQAAVSADLNDATSVATTVIAATDPGSITGSTAASVIAITGSIASLAPAHSGTLTDSSLETLAKTVIALGPTYLDSGVAGAVAQYFPNTSSGNTDRANFANMVATQVTSGGNTLGADVPTIAANIAKTLSNDPTTFGADEAAIALQAASALNSSGSQYLIYVPVVATQVASNTGNTLATQVLVAQDLSTNNAYVSQALTTATSVEALSLVSNAPLTTATSYGTAIPAQAPGIAYVAAVKGGTLTSAENIGVALSEIPAVSSNFQSEGSFSESGSIAAEVAYAAGPTADPVDGGATTLNETLYLVAQKFGQNMGNGSTQIPYSNAQGIAVGLALQSVQSNPAYNGNNLDAVPAIASGLTENMGSSADIENVLNELITVYPSETPDILGSIIATLPVGAGVTAAQLESSAEHFIDNSTLLAELASALPNPIPESAMDAYADMQISMAYTIATTYTNGGRYVTGTGLTPDETPVVDL